MVERFTRQTLAPNEMVYVLKSQSHAIWPSLMVLTFGIGCFAQSSFWLDLPGTPEPLRHPAMAVTTVALLTAISFFLILWGIKRSGPHLGIHPDGLWFRTAGWRRQLSWFSWNELQRVEVRNGVNSLSLTLSTTNGDSWRVSTPRLAKPRDEVASILATISAGRCEVTR